MARSSATSARRLAAREREQRAVQLRRAGMSYDGIAKTLECTRSGAFKCVARVLARLAKDATEDGTVIRALEVQRLDALLVAVWPTAAKGDLGAVDRALRIAERRAKLLGLDEPAKQLVGPMLTLVDAHKLVYGENGELPRFDGRADAAAMRAAGVFSGGDDD